MIRRATIRDLDAIVALENACFKVVDRESHENLRISLLSKANIFLIALHDGIVIGYSWVSCRRQTNLYSICSIRHGFGHVLLAATESAVWKRGRRRLHLKVRVGNWRAIKLYERAGYKRLGDLKKYYGDGVTARRYAKWL